MNTFKDKIKAGTDKGKETASCDLKLSETNCGNGE